MSDEDRIKIRVSEDGLEAWASLGEGEPLDRALAALDIREGLEDVALAEFVESLRFQSARRGEARLAHGQAAYDDRSRPHRRRRFMHHGDRPADAPRGVRTAPVLDANELVGVFSFMDVLKACL